MPIFAFLKDNPLLPAAAAAAIELVLVSAGAGTARSSCLTAATVLVVVDVDDGTDVAVVAAAGLSSDCLLGVALLRGGEGRGGEGGGCEETKNQEYFHWIQ